MQAGGLASGFVDEEAEGKQTLRYMDYMEYKPLEYTEYMQPLEYTYYMDYIDTRQS
jgi:hypothetical protein